MAAGQEAHFQAGPFLAPCPTTVPFLPLVTGQVGWPGGRGMPPGNPSPWCMPGRCRCCCCCCCCACIIICCCCMCICIMCGCMGHCCWLHVRVHIVSPLLLLELQAVWWWVAICLMHFRRAAGDAHPAVAATVIIINDNKMRNDLNMPVQHLSTQITGLRPDVVGLGGTLGPDLLLGKPIAMPAGFELVAAPAPTASPKCRSASC